MRFAVCDMPAGALNWLPAALERQTSAEVFSFADVQALLAAEPFDLVFLPQDDFAAAQAIRGAWACELALVGPRETLSPDAIAYRPIGHLEPDAPDEAVAAMLDQYLFYLHHRNRQYAVHSRDQAQAIPHADICYFRSSGHHVLIHTTGQAEPIRQATKLDDVASEVAPLPYLRCHQRYLVDLVHVEQLDHQNMQLILRNGDAVPVSKRCFGRVVDAILARNQI